MAVQAGTLEHRNAEQNVEWNKPQEITKKKEALYCFTIDQRSGFGHTTSVAEYASF